MNFVIDYVRLGLFAVGLLIGVQIPAVVDQYSQRVDARFQEAQLNLSGFQQTADRYFSGDIKKLLSHYQSSGDAVFEADAKNIERIYNRVVYLEQELAALHQPILVKTFHVIFRHDDKLMQETMTQYSYTVPLSPQALSWGAFVALFLAAMVEGFLRFLLKKMRSNKNKTQQPQL